MQNEEKYTDMLSLPHPVSATHPQMSIYDRAAQFSPFAALTGYEGAIRETARLTDARIELEEDERAALDEKLRKLREHMAQVEVTVTYFQPDKRKEGGSYVTVSGAVKKIKEYERILVMQDGGQIPIDEIVDIAER